jgi:hypothetical protein
LGRTGLSRKELSRVEILGRVKARSLRLREAAELLELSYRQAKRVPGGRSEGTAAWELRSGVEPGLHGKVPSGGAETSASPL